jgi:hypothetical protein
VVLPDFLVHGHLEGQVRQIMRDAGSNENQSGDQHSAENQRADAGPRLSFASITEDAEALAIERPFRWQVLSPHVR